MNDTTQSPAGGERYDVAVLGSGIAGSTLAAILARNGVRTVLVDAGVHPRFAIGESTIPYTSALLRVLSTRYGVPEIADLATFRTVRSRVSANCGQKRNFGFVYHREDRLQNPSEHNQFVIPKVLQTESHLFRQDTDAWAFNVALSYGAMPRLATRVTETELDARRGVTLTTADGNRIEAEYVVDAGGPGSPLARQLDLRDDPTRLNHNSRGLFTHMVDVTPFDETAAGRRMSQPSPWHSGTLHHVFDGGWMWVIPFDNHHGASNRLTSVGLSLDPEKFPADERGPAAEFEAFKARFPDIASQFTHAVAARPWVSSPRLQYSSKTVVGDRFCLAAHAAGFVDPLYSRGLTSTFEVVNALAWRLIAASRDGDWSTERFRYVDQLDRGLLETHDDLVHSSFNSFADYDLWNATFRTWALGTVLGTLHLEAIYFDFVRHRDASVFLEREAAKYVGSPFPLSEGFNDLMKSTLARNRAVVGGELAAARAAKEIMADIRCADYVPPPFGFSDAGNHYIHPTPPKMAQAVAWSKRSAPPEIGPLIRGALAGFARERVRGHI